MNDDTIKELLLNNQENFKKVFAILESVVSGLSNLESRVAALEAKDAITKPLWQEMRADQQRILDILQEHSARMDHLEAHLQQQDERMDRIEVHLQRQDEKIASLENKMDGLEIKVEDGFFRISDKFEMLTEKWIESQLELRYVKRRVERLESVKG